MPLGRVLRRARGPVASDGASEILRFGRSVAPNRPGAPALTEHYPLLLLLLLDNIPHPINI